MQQFLWNLASQAKRTWPRICVRSFSSCFFSAISTTDFHPSNSNMLMPWEVKVPLILTFFRSLDSQNMQSGLQMMHSPELLRLVLSTLTSLACEVPASGCNRSRFMGKLFCSTPNGSHGFPQWHLESGHKCFSFCSLIQEVVLIWALWSLST